MLLMDLFKNVFYGPHPNPDSPGNQIADQLGSDNPYSTYARGMRGRPTMQFLQSAFNAGINNRQMNLQENQFNAQTFVPTQQMADGMTKDNLYGWVVTPGQRRYIGDLSKAFNEQGDINKAASSNKALDYFLSNISTIPGIQNDPRLLMLQPEARGAFTPGTVGQIVGDLMGQAAQHPTQQATKENQETYRTQLINTATTLINQMPDGPNKQYLGTILELGKMPGGEGMLGKLIEQLAPQGSMPIDPKDESTIRYNNARASYWERRDPNPQRSGGSGGRGSNSVPAGDKLFLQRVDGAYNEYLSVWTKTPRQKPKWNEFKQANPKATQAEYNAYIQSLEKPLSKEQWIRQQLSPDDQRYYYSLSPRVAQRTTNRYNSLPGTAKTGTTFNQQDAQQADRWVARSGGVARAIKNAVYNGGASDSVIDALIERYNQNNNTKWTRDDWKRAFQKGWSVPH